MNELIIYGASDDLVEIEGYIREEYNVDYRDGKQLLLYCKGESLKVTASFNLDGWQLSVTGGEWDKHPSWPIFFKEREDYEGDPALVIMVPDGTKLKEVQ